jgi:hypothetical protein
MVFMAVVPFPEQAMAHWNDEVVRANQELLASLDELRNRTDKFIAVSALATTLFAILTPGGRSNGSEESPQVVAVSAEEMPPRTPSDALESNTLEGNALEGNALVGTMEGNGVRLGPTRGETAPYPDTDEFRVVRFRVPAFDLSSVVEPVISRAITSPNSVIATVGTPLSFTVTTTGTPVPSITSKGTLSQWLRLVDNHDGTATITGTPQSTGAYRGTIKAKFGRDTGKYVVTQAITLTVSRGAG